MSEPSRKAPATTRTRTREATRPAYDHPRPFDQKDASLLTAAVSEPRDPRTQRASRAAAALTETHAALKRAVENLTTEASAPPSLVTTVLASLRASEARAAELADLTAALAGAEERYLNVAYATKEAICEYELSSDRLNWFEGRSQPFGHTQGASCRTFNLAWWLEQIHPDDRARMAVLIEAMLANAAAQNQWGNEYRLRRADGSYAWVRDNFQPIHDANDEITGALCSIQDLTPQREARIALEKEVQERSQAEKLARGQTDTLVRALAVCAEEPELDKFLGHLLRAIAEQLAAQGASLWIRDPATDRPVLRLCCEHGVISCDVDSSHSAVLKPPCLRDDPTWQEIVRTRQPVLHADVATDPLIESIRGYLLEKGVRALLEVPLLLGEEIIGFISIRSRTPGRFRPEEIALAQALAHQATLAMQLTRLADAARDAAVLAERNRIAQEIHDGLAQSFTGILMQVEAAEESGAFARRLTVETFASRVRGLARDGLTEARRSVMALRPQHARRGGLDTALRELALRSTAPGHTACTFRRFGETPLPPDQEHALFRIAQEAVSNALRHGQPDHVFISLRETSRYWELYILDDGVGIRHSLTLDAEPGFGLESMRERARTIGADWHIGSRVGEGTCVTVRVPKPELT